MSPLTTVRRPHPPTRPTDPNLDDRPVRDRSSSCVVELERVPPRQLSLAPAVADPSQCSTETRVVSTANWAPPNKSNPSTTISRRRPSRGSGAAMFISRTITLTATRPPASLQIRVPALSTANARLPRSPVLVHAARWWPNGSNGRPHQQCTEEGRDRVRPRPT